ncbi:precorrin-6A reductase [Flammeovirga agarivorans]|uniref:Precorrin-6A reductase n=1 Tax=Flammeovirga agarivorans TaxID=2726742 RepID=A0A7X8SMJ1_9BACT|nr:precorrin-6A reductase [Flammeovirga agarivorans]NLR92991.1 precorrin-6A reductase [Flammeovirga agarivorans]
MVLVFGGTTEGKRTIKVLEQRKMAFIYSTKTNVDVEESAFLNYRFGALDQAAMNLQISENNISMIIDAAHPFAEVLHQTVDLVAKENQIPVVRFGRKPIDIKETKEVHWVDGYTQAQALLFDQFQGKKLLGLTGVQTINKFEKWWKKNPSVYRILPRETSINIAANAGYPNEQLILSMPNQDQTLEEQLIKDQSIEVIMTKESGASGFLQTKIDAAQACNIPIIIIREPKIPASFQVVYTVQELEKILAQYSF